MLKKYLTHLLVLLLIAGAVFMLPGDSPIAQAYAETKQSVEKLAAPRISSIDVSGSALLLKWNAVPDATKYRVYRSTTHNKGFKLVATVTKCQYTDSKAKANTGYYYYICAVNGSTVGPKSAIKGHVNAKGPSISVKQQSNGDLRLSWSAKTNATSYLIYRAPVGSSSYKLLKTQSGCTYTDKAIEAGKEYRYYIIPKYKLSSGQSLKGSRGSIKNVTYGTSKISTVKAETLSTGVKVTWSAAANATSYRVIYRAGTSGSYKTLTTVNASTRSYTHTAPSWGKEVTYGVCPIFKGNGVEHKPSSTTVKTKPIKAPSMTLVADGYNLMTATWSKVSGATGYRLYYHVKGAKSWNNVTLDTEQRYYQFETSAYKIYEAYVRAVYSYNGATYNGAKSSAKSAVAQGSLAIETPLLRWAYPDGKKIYVHWSSAMRPDGFEVFIRDANGKQVGYKKVDGYSYFYEDDYYYFNAVCNVSKEGTYYCTIRAYDEYYDYYYEENRKRYSSLTPKIKVSADSKKPKINSFDISSWSWDWDSEPYRVALSYDITSALYGEISFNGSPIAFLVDDEVYDYHGWTDEISTYIPVIDTAVVTLWASYGGVTSTKTKSIDISEWSDSITLPAPEVQYDGEYITWDRVDGAIGYRVIGCAYDDFFVKKLASNVTRYEANPFWADTLYIWAIGDDYTASPIVKVDIN